MNPTGNEHVCDSRDHRALRLTDAASEPCIETPLQRPAAVPLAGSQKVKRANAAAVTVRRVRAPIMSVCVQYYSALTS